MKGCVHVFLMLCTLVTFAEERQGKEWQAKTNVANDRLKPGQPCIDFTFTDINGKSVSLKKFRGKYVYIDVWATWCKPCRAQIPFLQSLEKEMKGKKIVFVSLSSDKDKKKWADFVKDKKLGGVQLFMGDKRDDFFTFFQIDGIPRFILLDKKGNIMNADMGQPSAADTRARLMMLRGL